MLLLAEKRLGRSSSEVCRRQSIGGARVQSKQGESAFSRVAAQPRNKQATEAKSAPRVAAFQATFKTALPLPITYDERPDRIDLNHLLFV